MPWSKFKNCVWRRTIPHISIYILMCAGIPKQEREEGGEMGKFPGRGRIPPTDSQEPGSGNLSSTIPSPFQDFIYHFLSKSNHRGFFVKTDLTLIFLALGAPYFPWPEGSLDLPSQGCIHKGKNSATQITYISPPPSPIILVHSFKFLIHPAMEVFH
jgi:hypothetical protein